MWRKRSVKRKNILIKNNGQNIILKSCDSVKIEIGDKIKIKTPGGGGYGKK